jgi:glycosyltransferase involved in cell wall biosynthesis
MERGWAGENDGTMTSARAQEQLPTVGISIVIPVRDDPDGAVAVLEAIATQTRPPDQVIIVNDGSVDGTRSALDSRVGSRPNYQVVNTDGLGIAGARNLGIRLAEHEWIACTDAGCVPGSRWLEAIDAVAGEADFVSGVVVVDARTTLERVFALAAFPRADEQLEPSALVRVSHRLFGRGSPQDRTGGGYMAFRRSVWEAVGGFPLGLHASEDRAFSTVVAREGYRMVVAREAIVHWRPRTSLRAYANMFFNYSRGDVRIPPRRRHALRTSAYLLAGIGVRRGGRLVRLGLVCGGYAYIWLPLHRAANDRLPLRYWWGIPAAVALKDASQMAGAAAGLIDAVRASRVLAND